MGFRRRPRSPSGWRAAGRPPPPQGRRCGLRAGGSRSPPWPELAPGVSQVGVLVFRAGQSLALQCRNEALADLGDVVGADLLLADQEAVAADLFHGLAHLVRDLIGGTDQFDRV